MGFPVMPLDLALLTSGVGSVKAAENLGPGEDTPHCAIQLVT